VGNDPPLVRFRIRLLLKKSRLAALNRTDRLSLVQRAWALGLAGVEKFASHTYLYLSLEDVAREVFELSGDRAPLFEAKDRMRTAADKLLDEKLIRRAGEMERELGRWERS